MLEFFLWDRIREISRSHRIYQQERVFQDQSNLDQIISGGNFADSTAITSILQQTSLQINRLERYKDYEQMDLTGEISLSLDLYADESSIIDPEHKHALVIRATNRKVKRELEWLYYDTLQIDRWMRPAIRYLCKYGCCPWEIVPDRNRDGVASLKFMSVYNFTRIETPQGDLVGFYYQDEETVEPIFMHPWQVMHLRLTSLENLYAPYGRSILDSSRQAFKRLRLTEDAALIYRITRAPEKRKFKIPVGMIPSKEIPEYLAAIARMFKRQRFYNPTTGAFDERYSPMVQEDDFILPYRPDGTGPDIDTLPGAENLDQIADIEYFQKKMVAPLKIPFARVGIGSGSGEANSKSLSQDHAEFAKAVKWVQTETSVGLVKVGIAHLLMRGYSIEDVKGFQLHLAATSALEDLYRMETWQTRVNVMSDLKGIGWFPKEWIVTRFTDLSPDEIEELHELEEQESGGDGGGGGGFGGPTDFGDMEGGDDEIDMEGGDDEMDVENVDMEGGGEEGGEDDLFGGMEDGIDETSDEEFESLQKETNRLISESKKFTKRVKRTKIMSKWLKRREKICSSAQALINEGEFDGIKNQKGDEIVKTVITESDFNSAKMLVRNLIVDSNNIQLDTLNEEINVNDLPS